MSESVWTMVMLLVTCIWVSVWVLIACNRILRNGKNVMLVGGFIPINFDVFVSVGGGYASDNSEIKKRLFRVQNWNRCIKLRICLRKSLGNG